ncbi:MAG: hypothetical protein JWL59_306 [Chthoniobacteraceae bacterium]|nr:hypothetical protein [Chthoniobacteraceae bacterium]
MVTGNRAPSRFHHGRFPIISSMAEMIPVIRGALPHVGRTKIMAERVEKGHFCNLAFQLGGALLENSLGRVFTGRTNGVNQAGAG